jgi:hypothetical protein
MKELTGLNGLGGMLIRSIATPSVEPLTPRRKQMHFSLSCLIIQILKSYGVKRSVKRLGKKIMLDKFANPCYNNAKG